MEESSTSQPLRTLRGLPFSGFRPSVFAVALALPGQWLPGIAYAVAVFLAVYGHPAMWLLAGALLVALIARARPLQQALRHALLLPALLELDAKGRPTAQVLIDLHPVDVDVDDHDPTHEDSPRETDEGSWSASVQAVPLLTLRGLRAPDESARTMGYVIRDLGRDRFVPLRALTDARSHAWADLARMPEPYFELLAWTLREGQARGTALRVLRFSNERFEAALAVHAEPKPARHAEAPRSAPLDPLWCAGLPLVYDGPLEDGDRERLAQYGRRMFWWVLGLCVFETAALGCLATLIAFGIGPNGLPIAVAVTCMAGVALALVFYRIPFDLIWLIRLLAATKQAVLRDRVLGFEGRLRAGDVAGLAADADAVWLVKRELLIPHDETLQCLRVLPEVGLLLEANGKAPERPMVVHVAAVAVGETLITSLPTDSRVRLPEGVVAKRRMLVAAERAELARHIRRLRPVRVETVALALILMLVAQLAPRGLPSWMMLVWTINVAYVLLMLYRSYRRFRAQRGLEHDLELGWLVVIARAGAQHDPHKRTEMLPITGTIWTQTGTPASWRRQRRL